MKEHSNFPTPHTTKMFSTSKYSSKTSTMRTEKLRFVSIDQESPKKEKIEKKVISKKELQQKEYENEVWKKKLKEQLEEKKYRNISIRISKEENIFCLSVDGSQTSKDAFEIMVSEFLPYIHNSVMMCPHIYNNLMDEKFNWRFQKAHVMEYYKTRLTTTLADYQGYLIIQDRDPNKMHEIEQSYKIAEMNECKYFFCGYEGLREQALKRSRIDVGIEYLLENSKMPVFIMKDNKKRGFKNKGYQWLLIMDKSNSDCYKVLDVFLPLIDRSVDKIYGLTLMPHFVHDDEDVKKKFCEKMQELNFKEGEQYEYSAKQYSNNPINIIVDFVNHNEEQFFDFVLFLNNSMKFKSQKQDCDTFKYVKLLYANIGFCNYAYIHGYDYKTLSKLPYEIDERKYLDKINKPEVKEVKEALNSEYNNNNDNENIAPNFQLLSKKLSEIRFFENPLFDNQIIEKKQSDVINYIAPENIEEKLEYKIEDKNEDKKNINIEKDNDEIYSEIYGVNQGKYMERISPTKPKKLEKKNTSKIPFKIEPKNLSKIPIKPINSKKRGSWAPTGIKKMTPGLMKAAIEKTKKNYYLNYGSSKTNKANNLLKNKKII
jgi:hypothetical protein